MLRHLVFAASAILLAGIAHAQPIDPLGNVRPVNVLPTPHASERSLVDILNGFGSTPALFPGFTFDVNADQSRAGVWRSFSPNVASTIPTLVVEYAGFAAINKFGIWFGTDRSNIVTYDLLLGGAQAETAAGVFIGNGTLSVFGASCTNSTVACGFYSNPLINSSFFGFYFQTGNGSRVFSLDALNQGGESRFLSYQAGNTTNWAFAYEDVAFASGSDRDFNDMVVKVDSVVAVPEPSTIALLLAGLGGIALVARRRRQS